MNKEKGRGRCSHDARLNIKCDTFIAGNYNPAVVSFGEVLHSIIKRGTSGITVFSSGISVLNFDFNVRYCGII